MKTELENLVVSARIAIPEGKAACGIKNYICGAFDGSGLSCGLEFSTVSGGERWKDGKLETLPDALDVCVTSENGGGWRERNGEKVLVDVFDFCVYVFEKVCANHGISEIPVKRDEGGSRCSYLVSPPGKDGSYTVFWKSKKEALRQGWGYVANLCRSFEKSSGARRQRLEI